MPNINKFWGIISSALVLWAGNNLFGFLVHSEPFNPAPVYILALTALLWTAKWYYKRREEKFLEQERARLIKNFHVF